MKESNKPQLELKSRLLPFLVISLLVMQLIDPFRGWTILLVGLGGTWLISYLWARSLARGMRFTREMRFGWRQVGDQLQERLTLINDGWAPGLWVEIANHSTLPEYWIHTVRAVGGKGTARWYTKGICSRRGLFTLGPTSWKTSDPFGLYTIQMHHSGSAELMVTPPIVPLPAIRVAPGGRAGEGRPHPYTTERTVSAATVRGYTPGDSLRLIHWPTTARRGSLHVHLFDATPTGDWWVILDANRHVQAGEGWDSTEEHGVILAASLVDRGLRAGRAVGLIANGENLIWRPPQAGDAQLMEVLHDLALLEPGDLPLAELLHRLPHSPSRQASLILITPDIMGTWVEALFPLMSQGTVPTVLLFDPITFGGIGDAGRMLLNLSKVGAAHSLITRDLLDRPEARPGRRGQWKWRTSPTGRAIAVHRPRDLAWKELS